MKKSPKLILLLLLTSAFPIFAKQKPNVLFIAIDDLRPELGCYGTGQAKTPNIDKLAAESMRFDRAYCQVPICMGSRASLLTGILPTAKRFMGNCRVDRDARNAETLPEIFKKNGYTTISNGKIFHDIEDSAKKSWSEAPWNGKNSLFSLDPETTKQLSKSKQRGRIYESPDVPDDAYPDGETANKTIADLQLFKESGKPFFLACGFIKPHMPFYAPKKYWDLYEREKIDIADNQSRPENAPLQLRGSGEFRYYHLADFKENSPEFHRMMRHGYLAATSYTDKLVGDVLAELVKLGLAENTIVVIWGDHGWNLGEHNFWGKHNTMHLATRVPLIVKVPGNKSGNTTSLVETSDIYPSLCELAGIEIPKTVQGRSFRNLLQNPDQAFHEAAYSRFGSADTVITDEFSYTCYDNGKSEMLYDLKNDPKENTNIAANPEHTETVAKMKKLLEQRISQATN